MSKKPNPMQAESEKEAVKMLTVVAITVIIFGVFLYELPTWLLWSIVLPVAGSAYAYHKIEANVVDYDKPDDE